jgi:hypothetical protein
MGSEQENAFTPTEEQKRASLRKFWQEKLLTKFTMLEYMGCPSPRGVVEALAKVMSTTGQGLSLDNSTMGHVLLLMAQSYAAGLLNGGEPTDSGACDPPNACNTHGRCWTHSEVALCDMNGCEEPASIGPFVFEAMADAERPAPTPKGPEPAVLRCTNGHAMTVNTATEWEQCITCGGPLALSTAEAAPKGGTPELCGQCGGDGYLSDDTACLGCAGTGKAKDVAPEPPAAPLDDNALGQTQGERRAFELGVAEGLRRAPEFHASFESAREEGLAAAPLEPEPECTGRTAFWCPVHGDCTCTRDVEGECMFDAADCPLHNDTSQHAEDDEGPAAAAPLGAGPVQMQRIREGLDAWASKLLADRSDETVEAAVRALWLYRDTLPQAETPSDHLEKTIRHEEGQADNVPSAPHGGPDGDEFGEDDDPPPGYEVRSIHDKHAGGYTEQARLEEWEGERHTYRSDAVAEAWAHARNSAAALERIAGAPQGEAGPHGECRWPRVWAERNADRDREGAGPLYCFDDGDGNAVIANDLTEAVREAFGAQGEAAGPPVSLVALAARIRSEHDLAPVRADIDARPWGAIGWTLNQLNNRCVSVYERLRAVSLTEPASPHQGSAESASAPARPSAMAASWWPTTVDRIECDECGEPFQPYDQVRPVAWAHVECPEWERPDPSPAPRRVVARVTATTERVIPPITPEPHQGSGTAEERSIAAHGDWCSRCGLDGHEGKDCDGFGLRHRYEHSVVDVATRIQHSLSGSGDPLTDREMWRLVKWLEWRVGDGWAPGLPGWMTFDEAVRRLANAALGAGLAHIAEPGWGVASGFAGPAPEPTYVPKVGDRVAAWRGFADDDSDAGWRADMVKCIGCAGTVGDLAKDGTALVALVAFDNGDKWWWLCAALRPTSEPGEGGAS